MESPEFVSVKEMAAELGMDRSAARKYILKLGIEPQKRRTADSGNQLSLTVTDEQARMILKLRDDQGFTASGKPVESENGCFYVIQLVPELDPRRIKLGFAIDLRDRLAQHEEGPVRTLTVQISKPDNASDRIARHGGFANVQVGR